MICHDIYIHIVFCFKIRANILHVKEVERASRTVRGTSVRVPRRESAIVVNVRISHRHLNPNIRGTACI